MPVYTGAAASRSHSSAAPDRRRRPRPSGSLRDRARPLSAQDEAGAGCRLIRAGREPQDARIEETPAPPRQKSRQRGSAKVQGNCRSQGYVARPCRRVAPCRNLRQMLHRGLQGEAESITQPLYQCLPVWCAPLTQPRTADRHLELPYVALGAQRAKGEVVNGRHPADAATRLTKS